MSFRTRIVEIIRDIFDFQRARTGQSILLFIGTFVTFAWMVDTLLPVPVLLGKWLGSLLRLYQIKDIRSEWLGIFWNGLGPAFCFLVFCAIGLWNYRRNTSAPQGLHLEPPTPHPGLVFMLSTFNPRVRGSQITTAEEVVSWCNKPDFRDEILKSNWGTLAVAAQHHASALRHCWLACSRDGSEKQFEQAKAVVRHFAPNAVCHPVVIEPNDISQIVTPLRQLYREASGNYNLDRHQIIADFTGGTAVMSGGMILATLEEDCKIEYLRQDRPLFDDNGRYLTPQEIVDQKILITVSTSPTLVAPEQATTEPART